MQSGSVWRNTGCLRSQLPVRTRCVHRILTVTSAARRAAPCRVLHTCILAIRKTNSRLISHSLSVLRRSAGRSAGKHLLITTSLGRIPLRNQNSCLMKGKQKGGAGISVAAPNAAHAARDNMRYNNLATIVSERGAGFFVRCRLLCAHCNEKLNFWSSFSWCAVLISQQHTWRSMSEDPRAHPPIIIPEQPVHKFAQRAPWNSRASAVAAAVSWLQPLCVEWPPGLIVRTKNA